MKLSIVGLGSVGSAVATAIYDTGLVREMVLFDCDTVRAFAAAEDLGHASTFGFDIKISAAKNYSDLRGSDIVVIAAGANQKPGQTRTDLLNLNAQVIADIIPKLIKHIDVKKTKLVIVTNPLDVMVMLAQKLSGMPAAHVIGTGTMLDSARFKIILSRKLGVSTHSINSYVLGEHGDSSVLNWSAVTVGNLTLEDFCKQTKISIPQKMRREIDLNVHNAAYEIIKGRGATWDGIGAVVSDLVRCIVNDEKRILTVSNFSDSKSPAMSLPRIVGFDGVITTLKPKLDLSETKALANSAGVIKTNYNHLKLK